MVCGELGMVARSNVRPEAQIASAAQAVSARQQQILAAFDGHLDISNELDVQPGAIYDAISYRRGDTITLHNSQFFRNVNEASGKTFVETNMWENGKLPAPEAFSISRMMITFSRKSDPRDVMNIAERVCFEFWLDQKNYQRHVLNSLQQRTEESAPFRICEYCRAVYVQMEQCPGCGARAFVLAGLGTDERASGHVFFLDLPYPLVIVNQISFYAQFQMRDSGIVVNEDLKIWCHLVGLHFRGAC